MGCSTILAAAIPGFFLSSLFVMLLWGAIAPDLGVEKIGYPMAMLVTITLWIAVAPPGSGWWQGKVAVVERLSNDHVFNKRDYCY